MDENIDGSAMLRMEHDRIAKRVHRDQCTGSSSAMEDCLKERFECHSSEENCV